MKSALELRDVLRSIASHHASSAAIRTASPCPPP